VHHPNKKIEKASVTGIKGVKNQQVALTGIKDPKKNHRHPDTE
jgi:hypothetical protein